MQSVEAKADRIGELQAGRTGSEDEAEILRIFLSTTGAELTRLKNRLDSGTDHRDLLQLLHRDIDDERVRADILAHFDRAKAPACEVKVLSDIDDTFYANWKDERFPKKTVYPGVRQLYRELDVGPDESGRLGDLVFVTARPEDRTGLIEQRTRASLAAKGLTSFGILSGSFGHLLGNESIAAKKLENFLRYARIFPEYDFVFIGDSGQGDASFGRSMRAAEPERVRAVLIHDIVGAKDAADPGITFFDTYVGAALEARTRRLISAAGLSRVVAAARSELAAIAFASDEQRALRTAELERDIAQAAP